jgi:sigma-E factor negative regulatory protein RseC
MEQIVKVRRLLPDDMAEVIRIRESACSGDCHKCSGCGAAKQTMLLTARNLIDAKPGDLVVLSSETKTVLKAAAVLYLVPLFLFLLGYLLGESLLEMGALLGIAGLLLGLAVVKIYDRALAKKDIAYTITAFAENEQREK